MYIWSSIIFPDTRIHDAHIYYHLFVAFLFRIWRVVAQTLICGSFNRESAVREIPHFSFSHLQIDNSSHLQIDNSSHLQIDKWLFPGSWVQSRESSLPTPPCRSRL